MEAWTWWCSLDPSIHPSIVGHDAPSHIPMYAFCSSPYTYEHTHSLIPVDPRIAFLFLYLIAYMFRLSYILQLVVGMFISVLYAHESIAQVLCIIIFFASDEVCPTCNLSYSPFLLNKSICILAILCSVIMIIPSISLTLWFWPYYWREHNFAPNQCNLSLVNGQNRVKTRWIGAKSC